MKKFPRGSYDVAGLLSKHTEGNNKRNLAQQSDLITSWLNANYSSEGYFIKFYGLDERYPNVKELLERGTVVVADFSYFIGKRKLLDQLTEKMWVGELQLVSAADGFDSAEGFDLIDAKLSAAMRRHKIK